MKTVVCLRSGLQLSSRVMPPAKASLATLELPRIEGTLKVKMVSERRVLRPKATLDTPEYSASVWLSRDAPHQHAEDILAAFEDVREDDLTTEFKAALLNAGTLAAFYAHAHAFERPCITVLLRCFTNRKWFFGHGHDVSCVVHGACFKWWQYKWWCCSTAGWFQFTGERSAATTVVQRSATTADQPTSANARERSVASV